MMQLPTAALRMALLVSCDDCAVPALIVVDGAAFEVIVEYDGVVYDCVV